MLRFVAVNEVKETGLRSTSWLRHITQAGEAWLTLKRESEARITQKLFHVAATRNRNDVLNHLRVPLQSGRCQETSA